MKYVNNCSLHDNSYNKHATTTKARLRNQYGFNFESIQQITESLCVGDDDTGMSMSQHPDPHRQGDRRGGRVEESAAHARRYKRSAAFPGT